VCVSLWDAGGVDSNGDDDGDNDVNGVWTAESRSFLQNTRDKDDDGGQIQSTGIFSNSSAAVNQKKKVKHTHKQTRALSCTHTHRHTYRAENNNKSRQLNHKNKK